MTAERLHVDAAGGCWRVVDWRVGETVACRLFVASDGPTLVYRFARGEDRTPTSDALSRQLAAALSRPPGATGRSP